MAETQVSGGGASLGLLEGGSPTRTLGLPQWAWTRPGQRSHPHPHLEMGGSQDVPPALAARVLRKGLCSDRGLLHLHPRARGGCDGRRGRG